MTPTQGEHAQTEALDDLYLKLHGMSKRLESSGRIDESDAPEAYPAILDAMNLVRRLQCESAQVTALTPAPECLTCNDHGAVGNILTAEPCPDCTPTEPVVPAAWRKRIDNAAKAMSLIQASNNLGGLETMSSHALAGLRAIQSTYVLDTAQPAAPQGVAYAELPDVDALAQEIRRVDGAHKLGAGALAEALMPFLRASNGQAPATQQAVGNSGFDHKTAADFLSGKTVSDEALRKFVAASRGAHDDRAALRAQMLSLRGELASREAEIALLKRSLLDAEAAAPQPAPTAQAAPAAGAVAGPVDDIDAIALARYKVVPSHDSMFHRFAVVAGDGKQQLYLGRETECQNMARKFAGAFLDGAFYQSHAVAPTPAAQADSQPAPLREGEREAFKAAHRHLELDEVPDAWGRPMFKHSHVEASWLGWISRAARAPADSVLAECGNCFEGKSDFDHVCKHCGGSVQAADSALEDAARLWDAFIEAWRNEVGVDKIVNIMGGSDKLKAVFLNAARKQGGKHDNH